MGKLKSVADLFEGRHFDREVIILTVRWYLRFQAEPARLGGDDGRARPVGDAYDHYALGAARRTRVRERWKRFARAVGRLRRVDETYVKIRGERCYRYRAVDRARRMVDFRLSAKRNVAAAKGFFRKVIKGQQCAPQTITLDGTLPLTMRCTS
jgi:transposase-like protein